MTRAVEANTLLAVGPGGWGLRLNLTRLADRFAHSIAVFDGQHELPWLASTDRSDLTAWPNSPPFQQLSIESRAASTVALLVGMAGTSHWSGSIESIAGKPSLIFDIACRARDVPERIGSEYQLLFPPSMVPSQEIGTDRFLELSWRLPQSSELKAVSSTTSHAVGDLMSQSNSCSNSSLRRCVLRLLDENGPWRIRVDGNTVRIAADSDKKWTPSTIRWQYQLSIE